MCEEKQRQLEEINRPRNEELFNVVQRQYQELAKVKTEREHIEEMAKDLQETHDYEGCEAWHCGGCQYEKYCKNYFCSSVKQAEKMTAKGYRKQSEWISVEDDKPKNSEERVQVFLLDNDFTKYIGVNKIDTDRYVDGKWVRWGRYVTHWKPLPEPPKHPKKHFTPEDVRRMTASDVKKNYQAIMDSMKEWK